MFLIGVSYKPYCVYSFRTSPSLTIERFCEISYYYSIVSDISDVSLVIINFYHFGRKCGDSSEISNQTNLT